MTRLPVLPLLLLLSIASLTTVTACRSARDAEGRAGTQEQPTTAPALPRLSQLANVQLLKGASTQLATTVASIPGPTERRDRELIAQSFGQLAESLELLAGDSPTTGMAQRVRLLRRSSQRIEQAGEGTSVEPTIETGLDAAASGLQIVHRLLFGNEQDLGDHLARLDETVRRLDRLDGTLHRLVTAQALSSASDAVARMTTILEQRAEQEFAAASGGINSEADGTQGQ